MKIRKNAHGLILTDRITAVLKVETDIITSISASPIEYNMVV